MIMVAACSAEALTARSLVSLITRLGRLTAGSWPRWPRTSAAPGALMEPDFYQNYSAFTCYQARTANERVASQSVSQWEVANDP